MTASNPLSLDTAEHGRSPLDRWLGSYRVPILVGVAGALAIGVIRFAYGLYHGEQEESAWTALNQADQATDDSFAGIERATEGSTARPWSLLAAASKKIADGKFEEAGPLLDRLGEEGGSKLEACGALLFPGAQSAALSGGVEERIRNYLGWKEKNARLFRNPPPAEKPEAAFVTDEGEFSVRFYENAPKRLVDNFLKNCKENAYAGTKLFEIRRGTSIRGGEPTTIAEDPAAWLADKPSQTIEAEKSPLAHFPWAVSMYKPFGEKACSAHQFTISVQKQLEQDSDQPVIGEVVQGRELLQKIAETPSELKGGRTVPTKLVVIRETRVQE